MYLGRKKKVLNKLGTSLQWVSRSATLLLSSAKERTRWGCVTREPRGTRLSGTVQKEHSVVTASNCSSDICHCLAGGDREKRRKGEERLSKRKIAMDEGAKALQVDTG